MEDGLHAYGMHLLLMDHPHRMKTQRLDFVLPSCISYGKNGIQKMAYIELTLISVQNFF
jgi:hypothetical protein